MSGIDIGMSLGETYILASKVRSKLMKEAAHPNSRLRVLVGQANMLDNLMDHIDEYNRGRRSSVKSVPIAEKKVVSSSVTFDLPSAPIHDKEATSIIEYEIESDSDSDYSSEESESDEDSDEETELVDGEVIIEGVEPIREDAIARTQSFRRLNQESVTLTSVEEVEEEEDEEGEEEVEEKDASSEDELNPTQEIPALYRSTSLSDDDDFEFSSSEDDTASQIYLNSRRHVSSDNIIHKGGNLEVPSDTYNYHTHSRHGSVYSVVNIMN